MIWVDFAIQRPLQLFTKQISSDGLGEYHKNDYINDIY